MSMVITKPLIRRRVSRKERAIGGLYDGNKSKMTTYINATKVIGE